MGEAYLKHLKTQHRIGLAYWIFNQETCAPFSRSSYAAFRGTRLFSLAPLKLVFELIIATLGKQNILFTANIVAMRTRSTLVLRWRLPGVRHPGIFMYNCTEFIPRMVWPTWLNMLPGVTTWKATNKFLGLKFDRKCSRLWITGYKLKRNWVLFDFRRKHVFVADAKRKTRTSWKTNKQIHTRHVSREDSTLLSVFIILTDNSTRFRHKTIAWETWKTFISETQKQPHAHFADPFAQYHEMTNPQTSSRS